MRKITLTLSAALLAAPFFVIGQEPEKKAAAAAETPASMQDISYAIGAQIGNQMKQQDLELDFEAFNAGLKDSLKGAGSKFDEAKTREIMMAFQKQAQSRMMAKQAGESTKNKEAGKAFLAANGKREGVKTTASGLQYEVMKDGTGAKPTATSKVKVHYHGTLTDGTVFDSSVQRGEPISFPLNGVIKGWTEGVQLMPVGSKFKFYIPSDLAYGDAGSPPKIGAGATLIFEVELLAIE